MFMVTNFLTQVALIFGEFWAAYFENHLFQVKTAVATFWRLLTNWATFYFNNWSHGDRVREREIVIDCPSSERSTST